MPHYLWTGPGELEEAELARATIPQLVTPASPDDTPEPADTATHETFFHCTVQDCGKKFKLAAIMARHFNSNHTDLREDKDTWREFTEEVVE